MTVNSKSAVWGHGMIGLLVIVAIVTVNPAQAGTKENLGLGINLGFQKLYGDDAHTGFAPASEMTFQYLIGKRFQLALGLGYGELSDGSPFDEHRYTTRMLISDLRANWLFSQRRFRPFLSVGIGLHHWQFNGDKWDPGTARRLDQIEKTNWALAYHSISGGGFELFMSPRVAFQALADYRFVLGDQADYLDGRLGGDSKDGYLNLRAGLAFYFENQLQTQAPKPQLIADLIGAEASPFGDIDSLDLETDTLATKIDRLNNAENEPSPDQFTLLRDRIAELRKKIESGDQEISQLVTSLKDSESRMQELETEYQLMTQKPRQHKPAAGSISGASSVNAGYENALRDYYSNNFDLAIQKFTDLINQWPQHRLTGNCQYWIGECYYALGSYTEATQAFEKVFDFPDSPKNDDATMMLGKCALKTGDYAAARAYLQKLMQDYPKSEYSARAQSLLSNIK